MVDSFIFRDSSENRTLDTEFADTQKLGRSRIMTKLKLTLFLLILIGIAVNVWSVWAGEYIDPPATGLPPTTARGMHVCDEGHVMSGIDVAQNRFLCVSPFLGGNPDDAKRRVIDTNSFSFIAGEPIHTCPRGMVMKGFEESRNWLLCETAGIDESTTHADLSTTRMGMHACPSGQVMKGIRVDRNILVCVNLGSF